MNLDYNILLLLAGLGNMAIALLHIIMIFLGAAAYQYFDAGEKMVRMAESGSPVPAIITSGITAVFALFGTYALSGAGIIQPFPFLEPVLIGIGVIFTLRGLAVAYFLYLLITSGQMEFMKETIFSLVALIIGLFYLVGVNQLVNGNFQHLFSISQYYSTV